MPRNKNIKITVITVVRNDVGNIMTTIESCLAQSWENVEYIVIDGQSNDGTTDIVMEYSDGQWVPVTEVPYSVTGSQMEISIPAKVLGLSGNKVSFDFKWADNTGDLVDPISLCLHGDTAPNRRFNYRFIFKK